MVIEGYGLEESVRIRGSLVDIVESSGVEPCAVHAACRGPETCAGGAL